MRLRTSTDSALRARHVRADALDTLALAWAEATLIYLDPPFGTGKRFFLHDPDETSGNGRLAYDDPQLDRAAHLQRSTATAKACWQSLSHSGVVVVHADTNCAFWYRLAFERVVGPEAFRGEIVVRSGSRDGSPRAHRADTLTASHNTLLLFAPEALSPERPSAPVQHPSCPGATASSSDEVMDTLWCDLTVRGRSTPYPTEKSEAFARRIVEWFSAPDDLVVEPFAGSGQLSRTALSLERRVLAGDTSIPAVTVSGLELAKELALLGVSGFVELPLAGRASWDDVHEMKRVEAVLAIREPDLIVSVHERPTGIDRAMMDGADWLMVIADGEAVQVESRT